MSNTLALRKQNFDIPAFQAFEILGDILLGGNAPS
jgi:hypothetical protein